MLKVYFIVQVPIKKESSLEQENKVSVTTIVGSTLGLTDQDFLLQHQHLVRLIEIAISAKI